MDQTHPPAEVAVDADLVRALLQRQCPELAHDPLALVDEGWDNFTFRLGERHAVRVPRRQVAVQLLLNEQRWLPVVSDWIDLDVPRPLMCGVPSELFPWPWSVVEWVDGITAEHHPLDPESAVSLGEALRSLHRPAPSDAPTSSVRGVGLAGRADAVRPRLRRLGVAELDRIWSRALEVEPTTESVWLHGDLHARNVVLRDGRLAGLIDWGDMNGGDRATDLACAWTLFEAPEREAFLEAYPHSADDLRRACGWAVNYGTGLLESGEPRHTRMGEGIIRRLLGGPA